MGLYTKQRTIAKTVRCSGIGVHSGRSVNLTLKPAPINHGIKFTRTDLPDSPSIPACFSMVVDTSLATVIGHEGFIVSTIEHLMAAFSGLSIDNVSVELNSYEMPIMDGSAQPFTLLLKEAGIEELEAPRYYFVVKEPIELKQDGKSVEIYPSKDLEITCNIEYDHHLINKQTFSAKITDQVFENEICSARTFGFLNEMEYLKQYGFAKGGSLENVVVIDNGSILNKDGLRFPDEFVRHKLLDCIGDFSLLGLPILGHIILNKTGHAFNHAFIEKFLSNKDSWETCTVS
jgi:UDP-3-O-[3-hydroxymyristoyl] N-acetylglucosamine deacetylase